jgi:hypothetical protein
MAMKAGLARTCDILGKIINEQNGLWPHPHFGKAAFIAGNVGLRGVEFR